MSCAPDDDGYPATAHAADTLEALDRRVVDCRACPRLVAWREQVAAERRAAFRDQTYWARPVPGFGDGTAAVAVVGLAPAAHGANRTGRMFTGDPSGDFLFAALHRTGFANQPRATGRDDGMRLDGLRLVAPVRCAPPQNRPTPDERRRCAPFLARELELLSPTLRVAVALGALGWDALLASLGEQGWAVPRPRPPFGHGKELTLRRSEGSGPAPTPTPPATALTALTVLGCYHVSPHNTYTGRLTPAMLDEVLERAAVVAGRRARVLP
ncbi:uracil-DNA glycosylase family 4 [Isoptericola sp. CG 20/1183]|uniref:Type-5 uracil-DNA glycosylase n=1 Tax=Isoptericola halotolerans TaxID=300560 RepID=A0ABX5EDH2_9MICO|nr:MULTISPECIES: uracil-DNA glycosylase [Isoptericola]PRZ04361.1 uracil-DNA glycosylase family 4 [Isoptericola halotolerans]PRZ04741.1 uracil-DNA glycosylase family 4 [Isoptericola sp. CG 20/1183]